nr:sigma-70 family RNA polymerase sigma factor [Pseudomonas mandelii]
MRIIFVRGFVVSGQSASSLSELYRGHHGWLFGWLRKKLGCPDNAADLAHDTFVKLLGLDALPTLQEPRAYLLVAANRLLINQYHRRRVEEETLRSMVVLLDQQAQQGPEQIIAVRQLLGKVLLLLLEELEEKPRQAFLMARVDGCSYAEIARHLQVSESSVKQYLAKSLAHCHARLFDALPEGLSDE